jgi:hypothetical protein
MLNAASVVQLDEPSSSADIKAYTTYWAAKIKAKFNLSDKTEAFITSAICERSEGMAHSTHYTPR